MHDSRCSWQLNTRNNDTCSRTIRRGRIRTIAAYSITAMTDSSQLSINELHVHVPKYVTRIYLSCMCNLHCTQYRHWRRSIHGVSWLTPSLFKTGCVCARACVRVCVSVCCNSNYDVETDTCTETRVFNRIELNLLTRTLAAIRSRIDKYVKV